MCVSDYCESTLEEWITGDLLVKGHIIERRLVCTKRQFPTQKKNEDAKNRSGKARCPLRKLALLGMIALHEFVKRSTKIVQNSSLNPKSICTKCCNRQHLSLFLSLTQSRKNITCMLHQMQFITILISKQFLAKITFQSTFAGFLVTKMFF